MMIQFKSYGEILDFRDLERDYIELNAFLVTQKEGGKKNSGIRQTVQLVSCGDIKNDLSYASLGTKLLPSQICLELDKSTIITGSQAEELFSYLEIRFEACNHLINPSCKPKKPTPSEKVTDINGPSGLKQAYETFQNLVIEFNFIEAGADVKNFKNPILYNLNTNNQVRAHLYSEKIFDFYLGELRVETKSGWFVEKLESKSALRVAGQFFDAIQREPSINEELQVEGEENYIKPRPYAVARFLVSNQVMVVERKYTTILDCLSSIGGVSQFITFTCVFIMIFHNEILLEQSLLNEGILQVQKDREKSKKIKNPAIDFVNFETLKIHRQDAMQHKQLIAASNDSSPYSYYEVLQFKFLCCGKKNTKKYMDYENHTSHIKKNLDIRNMISANSNINILSELLLDPYQLKLMSVVYKKYEDDKAGPEKITVDIAIQELFKNQSSRKEEDKYDDLKRKVDLYLLKHLGYDDDNQKSFKMNEHEEQEPQAMPIYRGMLIQNVGLGSTL